MKIKGTLLATAAGFAAVPVMGGSVAGAADLPRKAPAPVPAPVAVSWTGWYIGAHAGGYWHHGNSDSEFFLASHGTQTGTGFIGGGQIGYNWQTGNALLGLEADISGLTGKASHQNDNSPPKGAEQKIRWLSTVRARAGLAVGNAMAYVTGGVAFGGVKYRSVHPESTGSGVKSESKTRVGWTAGGGVEQMWGRNWTIGAEVLFVDFGRRTVPAANGDTSKTTRFSTQAVIGRVKLNYKF